MSATKHPMGSADAAWFRMDQPTNRMIITSVLTFDAPLDVAAVRDLLDDRLAGPFPRFRQVVVVDALGRLCWQDAEAFDVAVHVHRLALPAPGDQPALQELVSDLMATGLDPLKPLWDVFLVEGYGDGCALVVRMHHCIADGIALARVLLSLTDDAGQRAPSAAPEAAGPPAPPARSPARRLAGALIHESFQTLVHPERVVELVREAARDVGAMTALLGAPNDPRSGLKDPDHGIAQRVAWTAPLALQDVKDVAHATGTTVNDVLMTALGGALGRYLQPAGDVPAELHAMVPFNLRPLEEPLRELGNRFGLVLIGLPLAAGAPRERLDEVHRRMVAIKESRQPAVSYATLAVAGAAPAQAEAALIGLMTKKSTAVVTNVPGPREPVLLTGVPVRDVLVWAPCSGTIGMSVSMFSYRDTITVGFMTHAALVPEPRRLAGAMVAELEALRPAAGQRSAGA